jgi:2-aminoethylphosphonate-pyruvate transaminase
MASFTVRRRITGGRYVVCGVVTPDANASLDFNLVLRRCLTLTGVHNYHPRHLVQALDFILAQRRRFPFADLVDGRYRRNSEAFVEGMAEIGIAAFLPQDLRAPIILTFHAPRDPAFRFLKMYHRVQARGFTLYPGKLTRIETFRVGCIGAIDHAAVMSAVAAIRDALAGMGVADLARQTA